MTSLTGPNEAWYVGASESHAALAESMKRRDKDPVLSAELARLDLADSQYINGARTIQAIANADLSVGDFPDLSRVRFFEFTLFRLHPGHETQFEEAAKAYAAARKRADPKAGYRVYRVIAGMPTPAYIVLASVEDYSQFDQRLAAGMATFKEDTTEEKGALKVGSEAIISEESNRFRVDPRQSYVPKEIRETDPDFWMPK